MCGQLCVPISALIKFAAKRAGQIIQTNASTVFFFAESTEKWHQQPPSQLQRLFIAGNWADNFTLAISLIA